MGTRTNNLKIAALLAAAFIPAVANAQTSKMTLQGVFRDFRSANINKGGHPDFEPKSFPAGAGVFEKIAQDQLDASSKMVFRSTGSKVTSMSKDASGRNIIGAKSYITARAGDTAMSSNPSAGAAVTSSTSFGQWYNETATAAPSQVVNLEFDLIGNRMKFDAEPRKEFQKTIGTGANKNWGYTFELESEFTYKASNNDYILAGADDCVWVYVDGKLVIDLGGLHGYQEQYFEMNRLQGLVDGKKYSIKVFYAERNKTQSWLKLDMSCPLSPLNTPQVSGHFD